MTSQRSINILYIALIIITLVTYAAAAFTIYNLQLLPAKFLIPALVLADILVLIMLVVAWRGKRSAKIKIGVTIACIGIIALSAYAFVAGQATNSLLSNISTTDSSDRYLDTSKPFIIYISGIDSMDDPMSKSRSDVNILAAVNPRTNQILLVNTPRDYYVTLADVGEKDKLTHTGTYGVDASRQTLEDLYGVSIDYYMRVNFSSLTKVVDTLGGVTVLSDNAFTAEGVSFQQGENTLTGAEALIFARERNSFSEGDRTRGENQQKVIEAIIRKASDPSVLTRYPEFIRSVGDALRTNMSTGRLTSLINTQLDTMEPWQTDSISVNGFDSENTTYSTGSAIVYVMEPDMSSVQQAKNAIRNVLED